MTEMIGQDSPAEKPHLFSIPPLFHSYQSEMDLMQESRNRIRYVSANECPAAQENVAWTVTAASFGFALVQLDVTIVNVALPAIAQALRATVAELQWVVDAYALCFAALLLSAGFLGDRFGPRRIYRAGIVLFALASFACGLAPDAGTLIAARAAQGIGAAAMMPCSLALINHAVAHDGALRAKAIGWWTAAGGIAIAAGPLLGGLLLSVTGWSSIFLVNLPIAAIGFLLTCKVAEVARQGAEQSATKRGFDPVGQILAMIALAGLVGAVIETKPLGLLNPIVLAAAVLGALACLGFIAVEAHGKAPLLPLRFFGRPAFSIGILYGVLVNLTYYGMIFVLSLYLQQVMQYSPVRTGLAYLPLTAGFLAANIVSGWWVGKVGSRAPMFCGAIIAAIGYAGLLLLDHDTSYWLMLPAFLLIPSGMGSGVPAMTSAILGSVEKSASGVAAAVSTATRQAGGAVGVALFGALAGTAAPDPAAAIINGLHLSAGIAVGLLLVAASLAFLGLLPRTGKPAGT